MIKINSNINLDENELSFSFIRASGPGGQNVNKVSTAVQLKFDVINSNNLDETIKQKLLKISGSRSTKDGAILIEAKRYRTQEKNKQDAIDRLVKLIQKATEIKKKRKKTRPTKASSEKRIEGKKKKSRLKKQREKINKNHE